MIAATTARTITVTITVMQVAKKSGGISRPGVA